MCRADMRFMLGGAPRVIGYTRPFRGARVESRCEGRDLTRVGAAAMDREQAQRHDRSDQSRIPCDAVAFEETMPEGKRAGPLLWLEKSQAATPQTKGTTP